MSEEPHHRLVAARERAGFETASDAARRFGWNENTYRSHENGERGIRPQMAFKYAVAFKISAAYILTGEKFDNQVDLTSMNLTGFVDSDGLVLPLRDHPKIKIDRQVIYLSANFPNDPYAFEVVDDDVLGFLSQGDLVVVSRNVCNIDDAAGRLCFISVEERKGYLSYAHIGSKSGTLNLETTLRRPEKLIVPRQIFLVQAVFFRGQWGKVPLALWKTPEDREP